MGLGAAACCLLLCQGTLQGGRQPARLDLPAHPLPDPPTHRTHNAPCREDPTAVELGALAAQQLLIVDYGVLGEAMRAFEGLLLLRQPGGGGGGRLRRDLLATVRGSDDGLRKPVLARWLLEIGQ